MEVVWIACYVFVVWGVVLADNAFIVFYDGVAIFLHSRIVKNVKSVPVWQVCSDFRSQNSTFRTRGDNSSFLAVSRRTGRLIQPRNLPTWL